jgi:ligand-binding sensor domain-containing protein
VAEQVGRLRKEVNEMTDRLHVGTRKGLFEIVRDNGTWDVADARFLGEPVTAVLADGDRLYAALDLGHFGTKLWRRDGSDEWPELPAPAFPPKPEDAGDDPHPWSLGKIWQIEPGGVDGRLWIGTCRADCSAPTIVVTPGR